MSKLVVEVLDACDLMPKDSHGSASPYVEVEFEEQCQRTSTKPKDLNPSWNEKLVFNIKNLGKLSDETVEIFVYNDNKAGDHKSFLGKVRISGAFVHFSQQDAMVQRYPLDKRGHFSHVKGDIALKIYVVDNLVDEFRSFEPEEMLHQVNGAKNYHYYEATSGSASPPLHDINTNQFGDEYYHDKGNRKTKKEKEVRTFYSVGTGGGPPPTPAKKSVFLETRVDFSKAVDSPSVKVMQMQSSGQKPEYAVVETTPHLAARMGYWGRDKTASTYDLVEQMKFLYVKVVRAKDLPTMGASVSLDPYVEVKIGNYKGVTTHMEKSQDPVWNKVFAFSKERLQSSLIEVKVKDKDIGVDDIVGKVVFDVTDVPERVPPDSPLAPQWYRLTAKKEEKVYKGEIMLAVWMGTQADEAFPEAWHSDAHSVNQANLANTRSKVYFPPKLYYLRVHVISAQDLVPGDKTRPPDAYVKVRLGNQSRSTRPSAVKQTNPEWNEELMFVACEPLDEDIIVTVEDKIGPGMLGRVIIPTREVKKRVDTSKMPDARWFALHEPSVALRQGEKKEKFASRIFLRLCIDSGYHVLDESMHFISDLQPSAKSLRKSSVGLLEVGILSARNLTPMKKKDGKLTDAYCVAKYGNKWVRTRTLIDALHPRWNEQYTWEVYDSCTVMTIGVFDNCHLNGDAEAKDQRIGKVRIRLSTLETDRVYTHSYPLLVLTPSGLKKNGELHLAIRFTCTAWAHMMTQYGKPLLPKMHYTQPISVRHTDWLRNQAAQVVMAKLSRAEPPLRKEAVEYMMDMDYHMFSLRRSKANFHRILSITSQIANISAWFDGIRFWKNPFTTIIVHVLFLILVFDPELILPTVFLYLFVIGLWNYPSRPRLPLHVDARLSQAENADPDELDEEFDPFPTKKESGTVRKRYDRLRSVAGRVQTLLADLAMQGERALSLLSWRDPRATTIFIIFALMGAVFLYITPFQIVAVVTGLYVLRHPQFRFKLPSAPINFFKRLPARSDSLI